MHFVRNIIVAVLITMAGICLADPPAPFPIEINSQSRVAPEVWTFRNNVRTFRATFKDGTNEVNLVGATPFMSWSTNEMASGVVTSSWALVNSGTNGIVDFTFQAAALNYATITNVYEIGVAGTVSVYNRGRFLIKPSPFSTGTNMPVFTTNQNLTGYTFSGQPWLENLTLTTGGASYAWSGTGTTRNLNVPVAAAGSGSGITTNLLSSNAIITVYGGATAQPALNVSTSALRTALTGTFATGTPLYAESFTGSVGTIAGLATGTPLYVEADTNANANLAVASNALRLATGLLNTQLVANGLADTNAAAALVAASNSLSARITATESYTSLVVATALYTNRAASALASSVWDAADSTTNYFTRVMGIGTSNSLDGRLDLVEAYTSLTVATALYTNRAAGALQSSVWANADSTTNNFTAIMGIGTSNSLDARLDAVEPYTSRVVTLEGYTATVVNIQGQVTTNLTLQGGIRTDLTTFAASATNVFGQVTTNDAFDITSTNRNQQNVIGNFSFADSAILGANIVSNGAFANGTNTSANFWTFTLGFEWNSGSGGRALVSAGSTASAIQSNRIPFNPGQDLYVSYTNILSWTGSIVITVGGYTNSSTVTTGSNAFWATTVNDSNIVITINSTNGQAGIDDVQVRIGSGVHGGVAGNWGVGGDLAAGFARVGALTTTGTISGFVAETQGLSSVLSFGAAATTDMSFSTNGITFRESPALAIASIRPTTDGSDAAIAISNHVYARGVFKAGYGDAGSVFLDGGTYFGANSGGLYWNNDESVIISHEANGTYLIANSAIFVTNNTVKFIGPIAHSNAIIFNGFGQLVVNVATNPSAADGLVLTKRGTNFSLEAPTATSTNSTLLVNDATNLVGAINTYDSATVAIGMTSGLVWSVNGGALTAIPGSVLTGGIPGAIVTGAVPLASLGNVVQTGQVNLIAHNGTNYSGNLTFEGSAVTATGQIININAGSGSGDTFATNLIQNLANVDSIAAPTTGHALLWNGAAWSNGAVAGGSGATQAIATVGSSTVTSTISGATLLWSNAAAGGSVNWGTLGITQAVEGFRVAYTDSTLTNAGKFANNTLTKMQIVRSITNIIYDSGPNYGLAAGFVNGTNGSWKMPKGYFFLRGGIYSGVSGAYRNEYYCKVNGLDGTDDYNGVPGSAGNDMWLWNALKSSDSSVTTYTVIEGLFYNTAASNVWELWGYQNSGSAQSNLGDLDMTVWYLGDRL